MGTGGLREKDRRAGNPSRLAAIASRAAVLRGRNFRRFYTGYVTSLLGTSMSAVAVTFAVLGNGGSATDVGLVIAAQILPQVVLVLGGGVLADRLGRRPVMLGSDVLRCAAQAALAASLLAGRPGIWLIAALAALVGIGEAFFEPGARRAHGRDRAAGRPGQRERAPGPGQIGGGHRRPRRWPGCSWRSRGRPWWSRSTRPVTG